MYYMIGREGQTSSRRFSELPYSWWCAAQTSRYRLVIISSTATCYWYSTSRLLIQISPDRSDWYRHPSDPSFSYLAFSYGTGIILFQTIPIRQGWATVHVRMLQNQERNGTIVLFRSFLFHSVQSVPEVGTEEQRTVHPFRPPEQRNGGPFIRSDIRNGRNGTERILLKCIGGHL